MQELIASAFQSALGVTPDDVFFLDNGFSNKVASVRTKDGDFIIRLRQKPDALQRFTNEKRHIATAATAGLPVATDIHVGGDKNGGWMIQRKIDGVTGNDPAAPLTMAEIFQETGRIAAQINQVPVNDPDWARYKSERIEQLTAPPALDLFGRLGIRMDRAREILLPMLAWQDRLTLMHGDLYLNNVIVTKDRKIYIIDWGNAGAGPAPAAEVGIFWAIHAAEQDVENFAAGYGVSSPTQDPDIYRMAFFESLKIVHHMREHESERARYFVDRARSLAGLYY